MMTGRGFMVWADGRRYDGEWFENRCNGRGVLTYKDGRRYEVRAARAQTAAPRGAANVLRGTACGVDAVRVSGTWRPLTLCWCRASTSLTRCMEEEVCASSPPHPGAISVDDVCMGICIRFALVQHVSETDEHVL